MADLVEIQQLLYRYCHAHDSRNPELLGECFTTDVELLGAKGREAVVARYASGYKRLTAQRRHVLTNIFIVEDGEDSAVVQSYITLYLIRDEKLELHLIGTYRDHVVVEDGQWRIRGRDAVMDVPYNPGDVPSAPAGGATGR